MFVPAVHIATFSKWHGRSRLFKTWNIKLWQLSTTLHENSPQQFAFPSRGRIFGACSRLAYLGTATLPPLSWPQHATGKGGKNPKRHTAKTTLTSYRILLWRQHASAPVRKTNQSLHKAGPELNKAPQKICLEGRVNPFVQDKLRNRETCVTPSRILLR